MSFENVKIHLHKDKELVKARFKRHFDDYALIEKESGIPADLICAIHYRECSFRFDLHLVNGDSLKAKTINVPSDFPKNLSAPFSFNESAIIGLRDFYFKPKNFDLAGKLEFAERWNGLGYKNKGLKSPYLWASTSNYEKGLFVKDGKIDNLKKDLRMGVYSIIKALEEI